MSVQTSELYNQWLHVLMYYAKTFSDRDVLWEKFSSYGHGLQNYLCERKLPLIRSSEYISVGEGVARGLVDFVNSAPDRKKACGAVLWRFIKAAHPDMRNNTLQNKEKRPETYRKERRFQKNIMQILGGMHLDLSAKDKINALDYLEYKYSAEEYRNVYKQLGDYNFGEISGDFEYERMQTVKLFHELLKQCKKSTYKDKIVSAQAFLENVARNGRILDNAHYTDVYGNVKMIDDQSKTEMLAAMKKSKVAFSPDCFAYFEGRSQSLRDINSYLGILMNKMKMAQRIQDCRRILAQPFALINMELQQGKNASAQLTERYAGYLFQYASYHSENESVRTDVLESLLRRNAEQHNEQVKAACLFEDYVPQKELISIDKKLVLKIAENYAGSFSTSNATLEEFNPQFHERMTRLLCKIVSEHPYSKKEAETLCGVLKTNSDRVMTEMSRRVMRSYTYAARVLSNGKSKTL